jgi:S-adenosylmethionine:tRNA ribosyltransferase-isomerase
MRVDLFDFELPEDRIAQAPAELRDSARLLHVGPELADRRVADLPALLRPGDIMVVNDTRVLPCRLTGKRGDATRPGPPTGGAKVEVTLHKPATLDTWPDTWHAFARPARKLKTGDMIAFAPGFHAIVRAKLDAGEVTLHFNAAGPDLMAKLEAHGVMPLPPYIKRGAEGLGSDRHDYQTMFAAQPGADRRAPFHAGIDAGDRASRCICGAPDAARRRRHLPAGQDRRYPRPSHACRMGRNLGGRR